MLGLIRISIVPFLLSVSLGTAQAAVEINIDKNVQQMTVAVDGVPRYTWSVSSGRPDYETPNGTFKAFRMEADHFSKEFDDAPMPHSIFFTKIGHAIHGTFDERHIGGPASHGCVRLSRANAATLYALVEKEGVLNTTVTLTGSARVALARGTRPGNDEVATARNAPLSLAPQPVAAPYGNENDVYADRAFFGAPAPTATSDRRNSYAQSDRDYYGRPIPPANVGSLYSRGYNAPDPYAAQPRYYSPR